MRTKTLKQNTADILARLHINQLTKMCNGSITVEQLKWFNNLTFEEREKLRGKKPEKVFIPKLISGAEKVLLDACDGKELIANSREVFPSGIDSNFQNWGINKASFVTEETEVRVYEIKISETTFTKIFLSIGIDLDALCLTQSQIINFCKKHFNWLRKEGHPTLFLFKTKGQFFVARVCIYSDGLNICVDKFKCESYVCGVYHTLRVVVL